MSVRAIPSDLGILAVGKIDARGRMSQVSPGIELHKIGTATFRLTFSEELARMHPLVFVTCRGPKHTASVIDVGPREKHIATFCTGHGHPGCEVAVEVWGEALDTSIESMCLAGASVDKLAESGFVTGCRISRIGRGTYKLVLPRGRREKHPFVKVQCKLPKLCMATTEDIDEFVKVIRTFSGFGASFAVDAAIDVLVRAVSGHPNVEPQAAPAATRAEVEPDLVSCLMVTQASRLEHARRAIACYKSQTHPLRELVVVSKDDISALGVDYVRASESASLGDMRNMALARAKGAYIATWDDDDWSHPERLARQLRVLKENPIADGVTLTRCTIAYAERGLYGISAERDDGWEPTLLARRWQMPCYPALDREEDRLVCQQMQLLAIDEPQLYVYVFHGSNTWQVHHFQHIFREASEIFVDDDARCVEVVRLLNLVQE